MQASPTRDTQRAAADHAKALSIIDACDQCYHCECVKQARCNPCKAERLIQDALIADVRYGPAHNTLGSLYFGQGKLYLAAWEFEYASRLMPERPEPLNNLGMVYERAGKLGRAIAAYEEAVDIAPTNAEYLGNLARAHLRQGTPFEDVRYLLEQVVFHDTREQWVAWARDQLGTHPQQQLNIRTAVFGEPIEASSKVETENGSAEPLPLPPVDPPISEQLQELINPLSADSPRELRLDAFSDASSGPSAGPRTPFASGSASASKPR